jgi:hypothetical protein
LVGRAIRPGSVLGAYAEQGWTDLLIREHALEIAVTAFYVGTIVFSREPADRV